MVWTLSVLSCLSSIVLNFGFSVSSQITISLHWYVLPKESTLSEMLIVWNRSNIIFLLNISRASIIALDTSLLAFEITWITIFYFWIWFILSPFLKIKNNKGCICFQKQVNLYHQLKICTRTSVLGLKDIIASHSSFLLLSFSSLLLSIGLLRCKAHSYE